MTSKQQYRFNLILPRGPAETLAAYGFRWIQNVGLQLRNQWRAF